ncbi:hypothetical protein EJ076_35005 [Mesorhizobium sp. M7D.F.Ca.US.005.01.1.1]|uniref:hypothetical protein n=1 Tax=Mesorhizobium sp. M7D.F.Ca.US.005.01.1.1 TaxID=2493678 RepID=UPI000F752432|nr:hypothetical protein [Mesorhizobium sp. M7D.F.Ca.US.005.01.1.1]AZO39696.1 hypothetical protein EJ076_00050 [Mesorhizobium sp. M7D.F.Ca.US.005.01.1.1]AZO45926.1 hypothetical protein EJ076_35005 [Mesorhizobium sp. M7D.F.Ca.US.005.01.1.1]
MSIDTACSVEGCAKQSRKEGMCEKHHWRMRLSIPRPAVKPPCSVAGCDKLEKAKGLCSVHYDKLRRHGNPLLGGRVGIAPGTAELYFREVVLAYEGDECLIWPYLRVKNGYGYFRYGGRQQIVSRLVCQEQNGPPPTPKHEAAHSCGNGHLACVTKRHLSWKTRTENQADRLIHGTSNRGERSGSAKLSEGQVREIRAMRGQMLQRDIGKLFGVGSRTICNIQAGRIWKWLK